MMATCGEVGARTPFGLDLSDPEVVTQVSERAHAQAKPLENVPYEAPYRRRMIRVHTRRALQALVAAG